MTRFVRTALRHAFLFVSFPTLASVACSSSSNGDTSTGGSSSQSGSSGHSSGADSDAAGCVNVDLAASDLSCTHDSDCSPVSTSFCPGYVPTVGSKLGTLCPNAAANASGVAKVSTAMAAVPHGEDAGQDFCDAAAGTPRCVQSQCVYCPPVGTCGAASGSSSAGTSPDAAGGSYAYCSPMMDAGGTLCFAFPLTPGGASAQTLCAADSEDALTWASIPSCNLSGLSGCCGMSNTWQCFYGTASAESTCTSNGGTWSATSP